MKQTKYILTTAILACLVFAVAVVGFSVTYSKFINKVESNNVANVALLAVDFSWENATFLNEYHSEDQSRVIVKSDDKTIAPNLEHSLVLSLNGVAEVAFTLDITITEEYSEHWKVSNLTTAANYHPMVLSASSSVSGNLTITNHKIHMVYEAGQNINEQIFITWKWNSTSDSADTYMSSLANVATYSLSAEMLATQIN